MGTFLLSLSLLRGRGRLCGVRACPSVLPRPSVPSLA